MLLGQKNNYQQLIKSELDRITKINNNVRKNSRKCKNMKILKGL